MMEDCALCSQSLEPVIAESDYWRLVLNTNQNLLGKCMLVLRRHLERVAELSPVEWATLHPQIAQATLAVDRLFKPEHFNYAFLQNQDRHIHMHIIPRYASPRMFMNTAFTDPDYPSHYAVPSPVRHLTTEQMLALAKQMQKVIGSIDAA